MAHLVVPTSELEAVNECLENIGQSPVNTILGAIGVDTQIALNFVRKATRELQSRGWYWNTEIGYEIVPTDIKELLLPSNTLSVITVGKSSHLNLVQRGSLLYDPIRHSYAFDHSVHVDLVVGLPFEYLPEAARRFVALRAARIFQDRIEGKPSENDSMDELAALSTLHTVQIRVEASNILTGSEGMIQTLNRHS